jgi:hypothetical protein
LIKYAREAVTQELCDEIYPLLRKHYEEISHYKDIPLTPDFERYMTMDQNGSLRLFTARSDKLLIGYMIYFVMQNIHYRTSKQAALDIIFIDPAYRGNGAKFIFWGDNQLKEEDVQVVYHHLKKAHDYSPMLTRMGYELVDLLYARRLK